ncbi:unnamed protein product [Periconia digitata]|uniref:Glycoside hydrolase family 78 protein n=1 Tax=Periconia digitata TaxID=1303443 RepID=A0A9W4UNX6_9PLEO|nr:unnamed protein product [Periconia digitata]
MKSFFRLIVPFLLSKASAIPYNEYILAPRTRTLYPVSVHSSNGSVSNPESLTSPSGSTVFEGDAATAYDFGKNIAGVVSLEIGSISGEVGEIGVTFSESSLWVSNQSSDATADSGYDETLWFKITAPGRYTAPRERERGGFRYMTLVHNATGSVEVTSAQVHFTAMPHWEDDSLANYTGYFHSNDELLNRIWYAGAYTNQLCTIDPKYGNALVHLFGEPTWPPDARNVTWYSNYTIAGGSSALVDGAKRDKIVWAGDMAIAVPAVVTSTNDIISIENSLNSLFDSQNASTGQLPWGGKPFPSILSFTYHLYTLIGVADHYLYTGNLDYASSKWEQWKLALRFSMSFIDETDLMNVTSSPDWLRSGMGGHNIEANSILYFTINQGIALAEALNDTAPIPSWKLAAEKVKTAANKLLWNDTLGMYTDNETTTLTPQDGNSWAVVANLTANATQTSSISSKLTSRWTPYGAPAPEAADAISPFISGFELQAHFLTGDTRAGLELMRLQWGFMMDDPRMTNSTFIEGYSTSGALHYAPYPNDARISHAHGWAAGPTSSLTFYVAGIQLLSAGGKTWRIAPSLGDLEFVEAGFSTTVGSFAAKVEMEEGGGWSLEFETPVGTVGEVVLPVTASAGSIVMRDVGGVEEDVEIKVAGADDGPAVVADVSGGKWMATFKCG